MHLAMTLCCTYGAIDSDVRIAYNYCSPFAHFLIEVTKLHRFRTLLSSFAFGSSFGYYMTMAVILIPTSRPLKQACPCNLNLALE